MLFCGDGRCDHIVNGLAQAGLLHRGERLHLDIFMVPHYGSMRNVSSNLFKMHRFFKLPNLETLLMIAEARGNEPYTIHVAGDFETLPWLATNESAQPYEAHMVYKATETYTINLLD